MFSELVEAADPQVSYLAKAADGRLAGVGLACIIHRPSASDANGGESAFKPEGECFKVREIKRIIFELESKIRDYIVLFCRVSHQLARLSKINKLKFYYCCYYINKH